MKCLNNENGFSLIEVLIAMLLVMVGMLAVAGMQTTAIRTNHTSNTNTIVVQMAEEIVERIRVNSGTTPEIYNGLSTASCNSLAEPARGDCSQWQARMAETNLLNLAGSVTVNMNSPLDKTATVSTTVTWGPSNTKSLTFTTILELWGT